MWHKSIGLILLAALGLLAVPPATQAQVTNLAPNPSFEEDDVILNDTAWKMWCTWGWAEGLNSKLRIDDTEAIDGGKSLRIEPAKAAENWYFMVLDLPMAAKVGTKYTASFWAKAQAPRPFTAEMKAMDDSSTWGLTDFQLTEDWQEYSFTAVSQSTAIKLQFYCAASEIPLWLDFVNFYEGDYVAGIMPSGVGPRGKAIKPDPENGAVIDLTRVTLKWLPGDFAVSHAVYFSENFADVNDGLVAAITAKTASFAVGSAAPYATGLTPGKTYYWRVDEVNEADPNSPWKGDVWSFRIRPLTAWAPLPADGVLYVRTDQDLTWQYGLGNVFHTIYFGDSLDTVASAVAGGRPSVDATYDPGIMQVGKTYYWRVDEFSNYKTQKGSVWSFTTVPSIAVTDPDLLGWWTLDEGMGTTAVDWSGHGNHGAIIGDAKWTYGVHGGALYVSGGAKVEIPPLNVKTNTVTMTAWVKRDGSQSDFAGVLFKRDGSAISGMGFGPSNELRYHWTDNYWDFATGIVPPDQEWFFMALVVEPTQGTLYFNGTDTFARNKAAHGEDPFDGALMIGQDPQGGRDLKGTVDDVRLYNKSLSEAEIKAVMRGDASLAWDPSPAPDAVLDIRNVDSLTWSAGDGAASHDVCFGSSRSTVTDADHSSPAYKGNQVGTSFSLAGLISLGAGDCFWRIDEVEAGGTVHKGNVWQFSILPYLLIDDFESYTNTSPNRVFQTWIDGAGFSPDEFFPKGIGGNGSGAIVGYDPTAGNIMETRIVNSGGQSMPVLYDNSAAPKFAEVERAFSPAQNWTVQGVTTILVHFRGDKGNTGKLYVKINGTKVPYSGPAVDIASLTWVPVSVDLASAGVSLTSVKTLAIGVEGGDKGTIYIDDIRLVKP